MRSTFLFGTVFAAAMAVGVGAQSGTTQDRENGRHGQTVTVTGCLQSADNWSGSTGGSMTGSTAGTTSGSMTGSTSGSTTGTTSGSSAYGTNATNPAGARYVLTNVTRDRSSSTTASGSSTTTESSQQGATGTTGSMNAMDNAFWLFANGNTSDWSKYLNHRVEVKGMLADQNSSTSAYGSGTGTTASGSTAGSTTGSTTGSTGSEMASKGSMSQNGSSMGMLHVTSIKEVSGTCPGSQR